MFIKGNDTDTHLDLFRDMLAVYKRLLDKNLEYVLGITDDIVRVKSTSEIVDSMVPCIMIGRTTLQNPMQFIPQDSIVVDVDNNATYFETCHKFDYPIKFEAYGRNYLESDRLSGFCLEIFMSSSVSAIQEMHPNIDNAILYSWTEPQQISQDSGIIMSSVTGLVRLSVAGRYKKI